MNTTYQSPLLVNPNPLILSEEWTPLCTTIEMKGYTSLGLFLDVLIRDSQSVQIKVVGRPYRNDPVEYLLPLYAVTAENGSVTGGLIDYQGTYYVLGKDQNQSLIIKTSTDNLIPYLDIFVRVGVVGMVPAQIVKAYIGKSWCAGGGQ